MNLLVAGGAGFIGSHLCEALLRRGDNVICLDNLLTGKSSNVSDLEDLSTELGVKFCFLKYDVSEFKVHPALRVPIDAVIHLASPASPKDYLKYPLETLKANSLGTLNLLEIAKEKGSKFLLASTSEVYGDPLEHPQKESYLGNVNPVGPRSVYDESKRFAEALTMSYAREGLKVSIARIFNTYGEGMKSDDGRAIPNFIAQALSGDDLTIYGNGSQTRSFCYVDDMVQGLLKLLDSHETGPVNLGNPEEVSIKNLAELVIQTFESKSRLVFKDLPQDDPELRCPDISKAQSLGWEPKVSLKKGLEILKSKLMVTV